MKRLLLLIYVSLSLILVACGNEAKPIVMKDYGPKEEVKAGGTFNVQPNGESAIWVPAEGATQTTVVVLNGTELESTVTPDGTLVTLTIPKQLYGKSGEYPIYLLDKKNGNKSNELKFVVH